MVSKVQWRWTIVATVFFIFLLIGVWLHLPYITAIDQAGINLIAPLHNPILDSFFETLTVGLNEIPTIIVVIILSIVLQLWQHQPRLTFFFLINSTIVAGGANTIVKWLVARPRPAITHLVTVSSSSFPSGHSMTAMLLGGSLIFIGHQALNNNILRQWLTSLTIVWIILIGISRVYVRVHYPTDVLAGWCFGFVVLTISEALYWGNNKKTS